MADLWSAYEDLDSPRRRFALTRLNEGLSVDLTDGLRAICRFEDDTDINDEVSFRLFFGLQPQLMLLLSMVGPYALLYRDEGTPTWPRITSRQDCRSSDEVRVFQTLLDHKWTILSDTDLDQQVPLRLDGAAQVSLFKALFVVEDGE